MVGFALIPDRSFHAVGHDGGHHAIEKHARAVRRLRGIIRRTRSGGARLFHGSGRQFFVLLVDELHFRLPVGLGFFKDGLLQRRIPAFDVVFPVGEHL
ncbi:MAG: hypothetical protein ACK56I_21715, partial [bacterium]